jgi:predicted DNA binding CopG/RHH family protein
MSHIGQMAKPKLKKRLVVRIATPLINQLKSCAERDGRPLSSYVRKVLADAAARHLEAPRLRRREGRTR